VASAAYGSELAAPVQLIRDFRDREVASTFAGNQFLRAFNAFYYSFSPTVARCLEDTPVLRECVKMAIYPLIGALRIFPWAYSLLSFSPDVALIVSGLVASFLVGLMYFGPLVMITVCSRMLPLPPGMSNRKAQKLRCD